MGLSPGVDELTRVLQVLRDIEKKPGQALRSVRIDGHGFVALYRRILETYGPPDDQ